MGIVDDILMFRNDLPMTIFIIVSVVILFWALQKPYISNPLRCYSFRSDKNLAISFLVSIKNFWYFSNLFAFCGYLRLWILWIGVVKDGQLPGFILVISCIFLGLLALGFQTWDKSILLHFYCIWWRVPFFDFSHGIFIRKKLCPDIVAGALAVFSFAGVRSHHGKIGTMVLCAMVPLSGCNLYIIQNFIW